MSSLGFTTAVTGGPTTTKHVIISPSKREQLEAIMVGNSGSLDGEGSNKIVGTVVDTQVGFGRSRESLPQTGNSGQGMSGGGRRKSTPVKNKAQQVANVCSALI